MNVSQGLIDALAPFSNIVGAILTIGIFSILWNENPYYRVCEHIYVGATAAYSIVITWANTIRPAIERDMIEMGMWWQIIAIVLGCMIYFQPFPNYRWISRFPMALWIGFNAGFSGLTMRTVMPLLNNIRATMLPLVVFSDGSLDLQRSFSNIIFVLAVTMTLLYFFFSIEKLADTPMVLNVARWVMMVSFGVGFGNTVMGRITLVLGRFQFLFRDWLGILE
ncbi:MAG: hypothetical protein FWF06_00480 [Symbiobacteriaceae bacterium]|nr:hypothetical protein [Symbiobacteriaceae bacterium]